MSNALTMKQTGLALACALALSILSGAAAAQATDPQSAKDRDYLDDTRATVVKSGFGLCWHTGFGPPPAHGSECDPAIVAYVPPPAPVVTSTPVPAPAPAMAPVVQPPAVIRAPEAPPPLYVPPPQRPAKKDRN